MQERLTAHAAPNGRAQLPPVPPGDGSARRSGGLRAAGLGAARLLERTARSVAGAVVSRAPSPDLGERDPDYIREHLPLLWLACSLWYRSEVRGLGNVPEEGPVLLVGNHSGGNMAPDTVVLALAFSTHFGVERRFHQLAHNLVVSTPFLSFLRKYGTVVASHENAQRALAAGGAVLVYPGGDSEAFRPSWQGGRIDFAGGKGWVRLALDHDVPIVPVVSIGGQETALFLTRGERIASALMLDRLLGLELLPISIGLPWVVNVGDLLGHVPLPAKITVEALPAIRLREDFGEDPDVDEIYAYVTRLMQEALDALTAERRLPVLG